MMTTVQVQLFAPGLPPAGVAATARFSGLNLDLEAGSTRLSVPIAGLEVRPGGFDGQQWLMEWPTEAGRAAVRLTSGDLRRLRDAGIAADLVARIDNRLRQARRRRRGLFLAVALAVVLASLPILLVGAFWLNGDRIAGWVANHVGVEQEQALGDMAFAQMRPGLKLLETGPAPAMVAAIGARLTAGSRYRYHWFVAASPEVNAFALPAGYVVVYTGLIKAAGSPEEVAGVLAHEVQHVELRHSLRNLIHGLGWRAIVAVALGDLAGGIWADVTEQLGGLSYSRELERQADLGGLGALRRAGIAPEGMATFFEKLTRQDGIRLEFLSSHPASEDRMQALREAIAAQGAYAVSPLAYDWPAIRRSLP